MSFGVGRRCLPTPTFDKKGVVKGTARTLKVGMIVATASTAPDSKLSF